MSIRLSKLTRVSRLCTALGVAAAVWAGLAPDCQAQVAPPNDNLAQAQGITGVSGTVLGTNLYATAQTGEPAPVPANPAMHTIWYTWTAPINGTFDFNTRNSTYTNGPEMQTVLAVYRFKNGTNAAFSNLVQVASDAIDPSETNAQGDGILASRVDFVATLETTYLIQVDGFLAGGTNASGLIQLNWGSSLSAGAFGFSTTEFIAGALDDIIPYGSDSCRIGLNYDLGTVNPSLHNDCGDANIRITVTRSAPAVGRSEVQFTLGTGTYNNVYWTNYVWTNTFVTNTTTNGVVTFTNTFTTNIASVNWFQNDENGFFVYLPIDNDELVTVTNANGVLSELITNLPIGGLGLNAGTVDGIPDFFTNYPNQFLGTCPSLQVLSGSVSNADGSTTVSVTNNFINNFCSFTSTNVSVPSAIAGVEYTPLTTNLTFDDFQMSQDVYVQINPGVDNPDEIDLPGPEDFGYAAPGYAYPGLNAVIQMTLTNAVRDPLENPDILAPTISQPNSRLNVLSITGSPLSTFTNGGGGLTVFNIERATFRCNKDATWNNGEAAVTISVQRFPEGGPSMMVHYAIDSGQVSDGLGIPAVGANTLVGWPLEADSDYATCLINTNTQTTWDFTLPTDSTWQGTSGTLQWGQGDGNAKQITIPLNHNGAVEFDSDIYVTIWLDPDETAAGLMAMPPYAVGNINTANITINFDNTSLLVEPGGAVDRTWNVDSQNVSDPPQNPVPGADQQVNAVAIQPVDGLAVIGGDFNSFDSHPINGVARLQTNGFIDPVFLNNIGSGANGDVNAIVVDVLGNIIIGGNFTSINGTNAHYIARLTPSGSLDTTFTTGFGFNGGVSTLALDANGRILVGGSFSQFNTTNCQNIVRLLPSGGLDTTFLPSSGVSGYGTDGQVTSIAFDSAGNVVLGGAFTHINGTNWNRIARLLPSGALDTSFNPGIGADNTVYAVAVQANNQIVMGGVFQNVNGFGASSIARLNVNGGFDTGFNIGSGANDVVYSIVIQPADQNILVGGQFTMFNSVRRVGMVRLLPQGWVDTSFMDTAYNQFAGLINNYYNTNAVNFNDYPNPYNYRNAVFAMGLQADTNIVIGGSFFRVGGGNSRADIHTHMNVARIIGPPTHGPENGGIGNFPGNITMTQNPYSVDDTANQLFITLQRTNGSLGPAILTLGTNTLPPGPGSATQSDFGLGTAVSLFDDVFNLDPQPAPNWGFRKSDGYYGFNNNIKPEGDNGDSDMTLVIHNDKQAMNNLLASLSLLNINCGTYLTLGGVSIPSYPAYGQLTSPLEIIDDNEQGGTLGFSATNYLVVNTDGTVTLTVLRTNGSAGTVTVNYGFLNGEGGPGTNAAVGTSSVNNSGADYVNTTGKLTFQGGVTSQTFTVPIIDHSTMQPVKDFTVFLYGVTGGPNNPAYLDTSVPPLVPSNTVVTIVDGNFQPGHLEFSSPTYGIDKGDKATITVDRVGGALGQLTIQFTTANGTAVSNLNYTATNGTLTFGNQSITPQTFTVPTLNDNVVEGAKTVNLTLFNPTLIGSQQGSLTNQEVLAYPSNAVLTINDTDSYGTLKFLVANYNILQNAGQALITVTRTGGTVGTVQVQYATTDGINITNGVDLPAYAGTNYGAVNGTLTFSNGVTSQSFIVPIYYTPNETNAANRILNLILFSGNPSAILSPAPQTATLTILDPQLVQNAAGDVDQTTLNGTGFNNYVNSLSLQPDGSLVVGGDFTIFDAFVYDYVGRLLPNGAYDNTFLQGLAGANSNVWQVLSQAPSTNQIDGSIMAVGDFTQFNEVNRSGIARLNLDGSLDESFNPGAGADSTVYSIAEQFLPASQTNQSLVPYYVIGGNFANFDGSPAGGVARLTLTGELDPNFNLGAGVSGSNVPVHVIAIQPNNQILVGGDFVSFDNAPHHHLVRLNIDGTIDTSFAPFDGVSSDINGSVRAIQVQPDSRIIIGGLFTSVDGSSYNYIARLNADGSVDTNFNVGVGCDNSVLALALDSQTRILVGGEFTHASGVTRNGITRLNPDGTVDPTINFGFGANGYVDSIVVQNNDEIDVAGGFTTFNNISENNFVRLYGGANAGDGTIEFSQPIYGVLQSGTNAIITLERKGGEGTTAQPTVSAVFYTSDDTAINGKNYIGVTNTVVFPYGETFETVNVPIINGFTVGPDAIVGLNLTNALYAGIGPTASAELIITNVNTAVEFSANGYRQSADAPSGTAAIPIVIVGNTNNTVAVTVYTTNGGTATPYTNYIPTTNILVFYPGQLTNYFLVPLINSAQQFGDLTVDLGMNDSSNAIIGSPSSAVLTIGTVNTGPGVLAFSATNFDASEGSTNAVITIIRTNGTAGTVSATLTTSNGPGLNPGIAGVNYSNVSTTVTFAPGETSKSVDIPIIQQVQAGPDVTVLLTLTNATGGATIAPPNQVVLTIQNDLENFSFGAATYLFNENAGTITIPIFRNGPTNTEVSVSYSTYSPPGANDTNGYAVPYVDYFPTSGTLQFTPGGPTSQGISISLIGTNINFGVVSFLVNLSNPSAGAQIGSPGTTQIGIISDISGFNFPTNAYYVAENGSNIVITVDRVNPNTGDVTVNFSTTNIPGLNNGIANVDYIATNGTLFFQNGQATNSFTVQILDPNIVEPVKSFSVALSQPSTNSYILQPSNAVVYITNVFAGVSFGGSSFSEKECEAPVPIPVILTGVTNNTVTVSYSTQDGSGKAYTDYLPTNGTLIFQPGQTETNIYVQAIDNNQIGPNHTVQLNLSSVVGAQLVNPSTAQLTILGCQTNVVAAGTAFISGSIQSSSGVILSNDTVTIRFGLRDVEGGNTVNLVASLIPTNGITNVSPASQDYGVLVENGPTKFEPFTFTAIGSNGQNIIAVLSLRDNGTVLSNVEFGFTIGGSTLSFTNPQPLTFFGGSPSNPPPTRATNSSPPGYGYPSLINVTGIAGAVTEVTATLTNFGHTYPSDVNAVLEAPQGQDSILMSHVGSNFSVQHLTLTFDQNASASLPINSALSTGRYLPTAGPRVMAPLLQPYPEPGIPVAPQPPAGSANYPTNLGVFVGAVPNGSWALWIDDDEELDSGYVSNGWILNLSIGTPVENNSDLVLTATPTTANATLNNILTYFLTITNYGPADATGVIISNVISSNMTYLGNSVDPSSTPLNGVLTLPAPNLPVGTGIAFTINLIPNTLGFATNIFAALATQPDLNTLDIVTNTELVGSQSADLGVTLTEAPDPIFVGAGVTYTVVVTNNGPSTATNTVATISLPPGFVVTSALSPSVGTVSNSNGAITWLIGSLRGVPGASGAATLSIGARATLPGPGLLATASVSSFVYDPTKLNNSASVKTEVDQTLINVANVNKTYTLSWSASANNYWLVAATTLGGPWYPVSAPGQNTYTITGTNGYHFFRLTTQVP